MPSDSHHPLESPWFWLLVFSLMALVAVVLMGPKYMRREARLEQKMEGRVRAAQKFDEEARPFDLGERAGGENDIVTIGPLASFLAILAAVGWYQWTRERSRWLADRRQAAQDSSERSP